MMAYHACSKCDAPVRRSRRRNFIEFLVAPLLLPYRCTKCDMREWKLRFVDIDAKPEDDEDDEDIEGLGPIEIPEDAVPQEFLEAENAAVAVMREAEAQYIKAKAEAEDAKKRVDDFRAEAMAKAQAGRTAKIAELREQQRAAAAKSSSRKSKDKARARDNESDDDEDSTERRKSPRSTGPRDGEMRDGKIVVRKRRRRDGTGELRPRPKPTPQSHTSDEEEEQIWPS